MEQNIQMLINWSFPLMYLIVIVITVTRKNLKSKPWLLGYLIGTFAIILTWRLPNLLIQLDLVEKSFLTTFYDIFPMPLNILNLLFFSLLIPYILTVSTPETANANNLETPPPITHVENPDLHGIKGWLILPAIGMVMGPIVTVISLIMALNMFNDVSRAGYGGLYTVSILANIGILIFAIYTAIQFFGKKASTPSIFISFIIVQVVLMLLLTILSISFDAEAFTIEYGKAFIKGLIIAAIWIPYFKQSKRVKATFIN